MTDDLFSAGVLEAEDVHAGACRNCGEPIVESHGLIGPFIHQATRARVCGGLGDVLRALGDKLTAWDGTLPHAEPAPQPAGMQERVR